MDVPSHFRRSLMDGSIGRYGVPQPGFRQLTQELTGLRERIRRLRAFYEQILCFFGLETHNYCVPDVFVSLMLSQVAYGFSAAAHRIFREMLDWALAVVES